MGKIIFYVACSLDGHLSDEHGGVEWLEPFQNVPYDYGYTDFTESIGYIISGSKTYEQAKNFPEGWNFPVEQSYIFSSRKLETDGRDDILIWNEGIPKITEILTKKEADTWLLGGAKLAGQFFNENAVDELILAVMPVVLGNGKPLFDGIKKPTDMKLISSESFPNGVVQLKYEIIKQ